MLNSQKCIWCQLSSRSAHIKVRLFPAADDDEDLQKNCKSRTYLTIDSEIVGHIHILPGMNIYMYVY